MKLYIYDHCPYCVKARMIFGFKNRPFELVTLLNDDEEAPIKMIGKKMLPILEKEDGSYLPESLDIIAYVDDIDGTPRVTPSRGDSRLSKWLQDMRNYHYALAMPRWVNMDLEEFRTESARNYFTLKKEKSIGPFSENIENTDQLVNQAHSHLQELEEMVSDQGPYFWGSELSLDDFHLFAGLRCLTTTQSVQFPPKINQYMNLISEEAQVPLH